MSRPMEVPVLIICVTATNVMLCASKVSINFVKSRRERDSRSTL